MGPRRAARLLQRVINAGRSIVCPSSLAPLTDELLSYPMGRGILAMMGWSVEVGVVSTEGVVKCAWMWSDEGWTLADQPWMMGRFVLVSCGAERGIGSKGE